MRRKSLLTFGIVGTVVTAICCFTPALVVFLAAVGLSAWLVWLDMVLIPLLLVFIVITVFAIAGMVSASRHPESDNERSN